MFYILCIYKIPIVIIYLVYLVYSQNWYMFMKNVQNKINQSRDEVRTGTGFMYRTSVDSSVKTQLTYEISILCFLKFET